MGEIYFIGMIVSFIMAIVFMPSRIPSSGKVYKSVIVATLLSWLGVIIVVNILIDHKHINKYK